MSQQVSQQLQAVGVEEDKAYYLGRYGVKGLQYGCLLATPLYAVRALRRGTFSLRGLMRANWITPAAGAGLGSATGLITAANLDHKSLSASAQNLRLDANRVRSDDLHLIGSVLGALVIPALFLRRVGLINGLLGGAGVGGSIGLITHQVQRYSSASSAADGAKSQVQSDLRSLRDGAKNVVDKVEQKL
ncbi:uncharacterized protein PFL1_05100 [Pseudozyma flocculosa PF-1]|uniref:Uncharacterized protein n=2 Tax=Pseudozyma flocculosa TaxID=84751 RepID=A0A5C3F4X3_9BASI|nr:uncharacterized protein PFL1_05100 [Pseudozyma flocculosa PF-1]EPQ27177.1 hypothetical protein PFL1_05100 [Pseudozyma flocculosa PF-1]SPO39538.1 uncharacterized protein PSFLO_05019 [Pseudozyma flocculosa]